MSKREQKSKIVVSLKRKVDLGPCKYRVIALTPVFGWPGGGNAWFADRANSVIPVLSRAEVVGWARRNLGVEGGEIEYVGCQPVA